MNRLFFLFFLLFCSPQVFARDTQEPYQVLVSIVPYKFLVEQIAQDTCQVNSIVTNNFDPHTYELSPRQIEKFLHSQLWFRIGENIEKICEKNILCKQVDLNQHIQVISDHQHCSHHFQNFDTHTWLSPKNLKIQVQTIVDTLSSLLPEHAELYKKNGQALLAQLDSLDKEIQEITAVTTQRHILAAHGAFAYFCRDYDFIQHVVEKNSHADPSPKDVIRVAQSIRDHNISSMILLRYAGKRSSAMLADRFHIQTVLLDPYEENVVNNLKTIALAFANL